MKYLHAVLTVIAACLVLITLAVTGVLPAANARESNPRFVSVPVNADGSINVKFVNGQTMDVNIDKISGSSITGAGLPVISGSILNVNVKHIDGEWYPLEVKVNR